MRTEQHTVRIGENMGPIDWTYDFLSHFSSYGGDAAAKALRCEQAKAKLRTMEERLAAGKVTLATTDGGWPRCGWGQVVDVGMYDGWPYWRPTPAVQTRGTLGCEWHTFSMISDIETPAELDTKMDTLNN